jgi:hypothetical protein
MTESDVSDVRQSMVLVSERLPVVLHRCVQNFLTWLTGRALPYQEPLFNSTPTLQILAATFWLLFGAIGGYVLLTSKTPLWLLLPVMWLCIVSSARRFQVSIFHSAVHTVLTGNKKLDRWIGEVVSVVLFIATYNQYYSDHVLLHHPAETFGTVNDPDFVFLAQIGFKPGMTKRELWLHLAITIFSPRFHILFFAARVKANFFSSGLRRKIAAYAFNTALLTAVIISNQWLAFLLCWFMPMTVLYHITALLQFVCEHRWLLQRQRNEPAKLHIARLTVGRFLGSAYPAHGGAAQKGLWILKMIGHSVCRLAVLVQGLPDHDWHHRHPRSKDWAVSIYARQRDIDTGHSGWPENYQEVWGLFAAIDAVFKLLSSMPPELVTVAASTKRVVEFPTTM